jgi:hypothetical protein
MNNPVYVYMRQQRHSSIHSKSQHKKKYVCAMSSRQMGHETMWFNISKEPAASIFKKDDGDSRLLRNYGTQLIMYINYRKLKNMIQQYKIGWD